MEFYTAMNFSHELSQESGARSQGSGGSLGDANTPSPQHSVTSTPLHLDRFTNDDPDVLTTIVIGGRSHVQSYILRLHTLGVVEAGAWSKLIPLPSCPGKVMSLVNQAMV
ncbi:MAG: hypothetical protein Fur0046_11690 [Cyanobacteria bacterium J069]|nr:MAG: hypothetical protein D6742_02345 [Cyanobacteria bacterium J069]